MKDDKYKEVVEIIYLLNDLRFIPLTTPTAIKERDRSIDIIIDKVVKFSGIKQ